MKANQTQIEEMVQVSRGSGGQALVEFLISWLAIMFGVGLFGICVFLVALHFHINFQLQSYLICLTSHSERVCQAQFHKSLAWTQILGDLTQIQSSGQGTAPQGGRSIHVRFSSRPIFNQHYHRTYNLRTNGL